MDQKSKFGKIAFIGERELSIGFKLVGIEDVFIADKENFSTKLRELYSSGEFGLILASNSFISTLDRKFLNLVTTSVMPLVVLVPVSAVAEEEGVSEMARRVLGIKIDLGGL
ncbi:MAG: V-type ATP synthase subunit F [Thermoplasmatales archaeon]